MTNKEILYLVLGGLSVIGGVVALTAMSNAEYEADNNIKSDLLKTSDEYAEKTKELQNVKRDLAELKNLVTSENATIANEVAKWKEDTGYNADISAIQNEIDNKLSDFKGSIGYDDAIKKLDDDFNKTCEEVKERIGYNDKVASQKKLIDDANRAYDTAVFFMEDNQA